MVHKLVPSGEKSRVSPCCWRGKGSLHGVFCNPSVQDCSGFGVYSGG